MSSRTIGRFSLALAATAFGIGCDKAVEPLTPAVAEAIFPAGVTAAAGTAVATAPAVKVTTANGTVVPNVVVTFVVTTGGGAASASDTTGADGIATTSWTLGTTAGANVLTATAGSLPAVTFSATGIAGAAAKAALTTAPSATPANRAVWPTQPVIQVQDVHGNLVASSTAQVVAAITTGSGSLLGTLTVNAVAGVATFTNLAVGGPVGPKTITFGGPGLTSAQATVTTTAGAAATVAKSAGDNQNGPPSSATAVSPAVLVTDADANPVSGTTVTFAVTGGGGSITGATPASNASGIATAGTWTLGPSQGANTLSATSAGLSGSPLTFTATGTTNSIATVTPATLTSGVTATITGNGFSATPAQNVVTIDGVSTTVTAASPTSLTVTVPTLPCTVAHSAVVSVNPNGAGAVTKNHPVSAATQLALSVGQSTILSTAATARCNELSKTGGTYYVAVYNSNSVYDTTGAQFELKGSAGAVGPPPQAGVTSASHMIAPRRSTPEFERMAAADRAHVTLMERDLAFLRQNGTKWRGGGGPSGAAPGGVLPFGVSSNVVVGDAWTGRLRDLRVAGCGTWIDITGRVAYVGTKSIIIEDNANPLAGTIDSTYAQIGNEFDTTMWTILENNYGNPIANDAVLDNNQRIVMVFTEKLNSNGVLGSFGVAGFVSPCDFFARTTYASSNVGEYFYATSPRVSGNITISDSPPAWRWLMRGTIIHEVKHIVSSGERFARNGGTNFEESWLEETNARVSEELYERARYNFTQKSNIGYGSAGSPVGPYCGVRACSGQPRGIIRVFTELAATGTLGGWFSNPQDFSPIGRFSSSDFSFYSTGWSLVRWFLDNSATAEATVLKGMTQEPTKTGLSNLETQSGLTFAAVQPKWVLSNVVDDYPGLAPADASIEQKSWNFRDVFAGYRADFNTVSWATWPLVPATASFGAFSTIARVRPGTASVIQLSGSQANSQLLELKANGAATAAPAELRMAIIRVQ